MDATYLTIFLNNESVYDDQQNTEVYGTSPPHPQDLTIWPYRPPAWLYGFIARMEVAMKPKQVGGTVEAKSLKNVSLW